MGKVDVLKGHQDVDELTRRRRLQLPLDGRGAELIHPSFELHRGAGTFGGRDPGD